MADIGPVLDIGSLFGIIGTVLTGINDVAGPPPGLGLADVRAVSGCLHMHRLGAVAFSTDTAPDVPMWVSAWLFGRGQVPGSVGDAASTLVDSIEPYMAPSHRHGRDDMVRALSAFVTDRLRDRGGLYLLPTPREAAAYFDAWASLLPVVDTGCGYRLLHALGPSVPVLRVVQWAMATPGSVAACGAACAGGAGCTSSAAVRSQVIDEWVRWMSESPGVVSGPRVGFCPLVEPTGAGYDRGAYHHAAVTIYYTFFAPGTPAGAPLPGPLVARLRNVVAGALVADPPYLPGFYEALGIVAIASAGGLRGAPDTREQRDAVRRVLLLFGGDENEFDRSLEDLRQANKHDPPPSVDWTLRKVRVLGGDDVGSACTICGDDLEGDQRVIELPVCGHLFHADARDCMGGEEDSTDPAGTVRGWFTGSRGRGGHRTCPVCRTDVVRDDAAPPRQ